MHKIVKIENTAIGIGLDALHAVTRHRLKHIGKHGIARHLALAQRMADDISHVDEGSCASSAT